MKMSNSSLVTYKHIVKNKTSGRGGNKIQKIFVHHMAGNLTVKQCGSVFDNRQASAHYGVNGTAIGQYVDEKDTAWHCGNFSWNQKSVGIELANDGGSSTNWHVSDKTIATAIKLIADICKRNGIERLTYTGNMNGNICMHKWVASTSCPGPYLATQFARITNGVNELLGAKTLLDVDGVGGPLTVRRMQQFLGTTVDGVISGQKKANSKYFPALTAVDYDNTTSTCVKSLQWLIGVYEDGVLSQSTIKAWQKFLGVSQDGIFGTKSMKAWQKYLNEHDKAVFPATHVTKSTGSTVSAEPVEKTVQQKVVDWAKKVAKDNSWHYVKWIQNNTKTHECPICHNHPAGNYHGWNCIGFAYSAYYHGAGIKIKHNNGVINNAKAEKILAAKNDSDATKIVQDALGNKDFKCIKRKAGISQDLMKPGDICLYFKDTKTYQHTFIYIGNGRMIDCTSVKKTANQIMERKALKPKVIIRYTGK